MSVGSDFVRGSKSRSGIRIAKLLLVIFLLLLVLLGLYLYFKPHKSDADAKKKPAIISLAKLPAKTLLKPEYDFYQVLPKLQVTPTSQPIPLDSDKAADKQYWVQLAASRNLFEVNRLLRELAAAGFTAKLDQSPTDSALYRVVMGPYARQGDANETLKRLRVSGANGYIFSKNINKKS